MYLQPKRKSKHNFFELQEVVTTGDATVAFTGADAVVMLGAFPRKVSFFLSTNIKEAS